MALVVDQLRLWTIGFKWAGLDPNRVWLRIPPPVKDNFSTLLEAILNDHLGCATLSPQKWNGSEVTDSSFYVRHWLNDIRAAIHGERYNRKLLNHAVVFRSDFKDWCERCSIPLPEFWFPPGWTDYRWPGDDEGFLVGTTLPEYESPLRSGGDPSETDNDAPAASSVGAPATPPDATKLRPSQQACVACQVIATSIWKEEPGKTIADMCRDERILKLGGAGWYDEGTVRRWLQKVAPAEVSAKKGRPRKKNPLEE